MNDNYTITVHGDYQNFPEVKEMTIQNTHNHYGRQGDEADLSLDPDDSLSAYIPNARLRTMAKQMLNTCEKPQDILDKVVPLLLGACCLKLEVIKKKDFCQAMLPHLTNLETPNVSNIVQLMKRAA